MKKSIVNLFIFVCICTVIALLLAVTNAVTAPIILENQNEAARQALLDVMPGGSGFEQIPVEEYDLPETVEEAYRETDGLGYVIRLSTSGYGSDMVLMCGVDVNGTVTGVACLSSNETLGKEKTYGENFLSLDDDGVQSVDVIAGATKTTEAYKNAVIDALNSVTILVGGSADSAPAAQND